MPDFQEFKIAFNAEDNVTEVLEKIKKSIKEVKDSLTSLNSIDLSGLKDKIQDAFNIKDATKNIKQDIQNVTKTIAKENEKIVEQVNRSSFAKSDLGKLISSRKTPIKNVEKLSSNSDSIDLTERVYTIVDTYEKIQNGIKTITKVTKEFDADTGLRTEKETLYDITQQFEKISAVKSQLPNAKDMDLEGFKEVKTSTKELGDGLQTVTQRLEKVKDDTKTTMTVVDGKIKEVTNSAIKLKEQLKFPKFTRTDLQPVRTETRELGNGQTEELKIYEETLNNIKTTWKVVDGTIRNVKTSTMALDKPTKKIHKTQTKIGRLFTNIRKIILYRTIRKALAAIAKAFRDSVQQLAKFDSSFNETMSRIVTATDKIKASVALVFEPIINILAPLLEEISAAFSDFANSVSEAYAKSKGLTTYTKINAKYTKDYADSLQQASRNLSFDKFESLGEAQNDIYVEEQIDTQKQTNNVVSSLLGVIKEINDILVPLVSKLISIVSKVVSFLMPYVERLLAVLDPFIQGFMSFVDSTLDGIMLVLDPLLDAVVGLLETIDWKTLFETLGDLVYLIAQIVRLVLDILPIKGILQLVGSILNSLVVEIKRTIDNLKDILEPVFTIFTPIFEKIRDYANWVYSMLKDIFDFLSDLSTGKLFGVEISFKSVKDALSDAWHSIFGYANGGIVSAGNIIRTNENGTPEWLGKIRNKTAVVNDTQMSDLMYSAVYNAVLDGFAENGNSITIDFTGLNANNLARELAKPMANQFARQNIRVKGM